MYKEKNHCTLLIKVIHNNTRKQNIIPVYIIIFMSFINGNNADKRACVLFRPSTFDTCVSRNSSAPLNRFDFNRFFRRFRHGFPGPIRTWGEQSRNRSAEYLFILFFFCRRFETAIDRYNVRARRLSIVLQRRSIAVVG